MSTRATIRFATREEGVPFNEHPQKWNAQFYNHYDGYPEGLGVEIAESFTKYRKIGGWELEALDIVHGDIEYLYYVWQCHGKSEPWISIFETANYMEEHGGECIFVGTPDMLLKKYSDNDTTLNQDEVDEFIGGCIINEKFSDIDKLNTNNDG